MVTTARPDSEIAFLLPVTGIMTMIISAAYFIEGVRFLRKAKENQDGNPNLRKTPEETR